MNDRKFIKGRVSVLIGTYNRADLVSRSLDSVLKQDFSDFDIHIVDDCSTDHTIEVLESYKRKYPGVINVYRNDVNKGIAANCNLAFDNCLGEFIALLGDDDEWVDPKKLTRQVKEFAKNPNLGIVGTHWVDVKCSQVVKEHRPIVAKNPVSQILRRNGVYCGSSVLVSRQAWETVNGFDLKVPRGVDSDLFRAIIVAGYDVKNINKVAANVYIDDHPRMTKSVSSLGVKKHFDSNLYCLKKYKISFLKHPDALLYRVYRGAKLSVKFVLYKIFELKKGGV